MKYLLTVMVAIVMLSVIACDSKDEDTAADTAANVEETENSDTGDAENGAE